MLRANVLNIPGYLLFLVFTVCSFILPFIFEVALKLYFFSPEKGEE